MKIITFDTETRGLFGEVFIVGVFDGTVFRSMHPDMFAEELRVLSGEEEIYAYAHNLDFDFSKLLKQVIPFGIVWDRSIFIRGRAVRIKLRDIPVWLCDSFQLFPASLEKISKDFNLSSGKMDLNEELSTAGFKDKLDFFMRVSPDNPLLLRYLEADCRALMEAIMLSMEYSGMSIGEFCKKPTLPSLSLAMYRDMCPDQYDHITSSYISADMENFSREAYVGGRVEVVKPKLQGSGYHYDVNSLYPHVMKVNTYPVGKAVRLKGPSALKFYGGSGGLHALVRARVHVPGDVFFPVLPKRYKGKLLFPTGKFEGIWTMEELQLAERANGCTVDILELIYWTGKESLFEGFIERMEQEKVKSTGSRRSFFKLIQNSLYGKFGMIREREVYKDVKHESKIIEKGNPCLRIRLLGFEEEVLFTHQILYLNYVKPHIAAYVTSYARMFLYQTMCLIPEHVYYYDTDSLVTDCPLPTEIIDDNKYGMWKLERELLRGVYLQPKLYAEIDRNGGEVLRSKGLLREFRDTLSFDKYVALQERIRQGTDVLLYDGIPVRDSYMRTVKKKVGPDTPANAKKSIRGGWVSKREMLYNENTSKPIHLSEY